jgi:uncharacterized protein YggU (UPF0235/DUF167 family)
MRRGESGGSQPSFYSVNDREVHLCVKAKPHARTPGVLGVRAGELVVAVRAPAEKGKANAEIAKTLADGLGISRGEVVLKSGAGASHKVFRLPLSAAAPLSDLASRATSS